MNKNILNLVMAGAVSIIAFGSCKKDNMHSTAGDSTPAVDTPALYAHTSVFTSKTVLGEDWSVAWAENDNLTVFNAASGSTEYSDNCKFIIDGTPSEGKFIKDASQTNKVLKTGADSYDWYVCSPYMSNAPQPGGTKGYGVVSQPKQAGYNSTAHVSKSDIMAGVAYGVAAGSAPSVSLQHMCALMKFTVTNASGSPTAITGLSLDATEGGSKIVGGFTMDWGSDSVLPSLSTTGMTTGSAICPLTVENAGTVADGESVDLYMVVAPFTIPAGGKIKIILSGTLGEVELVNEFPQGISFAAGTYNTASLTYAVEKPAENIVFIETFGTSESSMAYYNKAGLWTAVPDHAASYVYVQAGSVTLKKATSGNNINITKYGDYMEGAVARFGSEKNANGVVIKGVTVEANTTYIFRYNKADGTDSDGKEIQMPTYFRVRKNGTTSWTNFDQTTATGTITQEFTTGDQTCIDIAVCAKEANPSGLKYYPALDYFVLIKK